MTSEGWNQGERKKQMKNRKKTLLVAVQQQRTKSLLLEYSGNHFP